MMPSMRILGIDPGLATIGIGVIETGPGGSLLNPDWLTITSPAHTPLADRLHELHRDLSAFVADLKPDLAVVERLFFAKNVTTALDVAHARGVILLTLAEHGIPLIEATPMQLKQGITGDGGADKQQVQSMLMHRLHLATVPTPDDAADAHALAVYGSLTQRQLAIG
jgi:crossover junction endodeoxyribonuclease RuvC